MPDPGLLAGAVADLLRKLPEAQDDQEFLFIVEGILARDIRSQKERVDARRLLSRPDWYGQIGQQRLWILVAENRLTDILARIVIPDLSNPQVAKVIGESAADVPAGVIASLLVAARQAGDDTWQLAIEILQPRLAYRWLVEKRMTMYWNPGLAPQYTGDSGRGLFKRKK